MPGVQDGSKFLKYDVPAEIDRLQHLVHRLPVLQDQLPSHLHVEVPLSGRFGHAEAITLLADIADYCGATDEQSVDSSRPRTKEGIKKPPEQEAKRREE